MGLLNWMRGGGQWRRWAQDIGKAGDMALQLASWELAEQRKAQTDEESILTGTATDLIPILDKEGMLWAWRGARPCAPPE